VITSLLFIMTLAVRVNMFPINTDEYLNMRQKVIDTEYQMRTGGTIKLSDAERRVNAVLMKLKAKELDISRTSATDYPPAVHFFHAKALIDESEVFKIIRTMPKGNLRAV